MDDEFEQTKDIGNGSETGLHASFQSHYSLFCLDIIVLDIIALDKCMLIEL